MHKQAKSNYAMQKVQPKIQALKDRFPDDPTRQSQEMQKIYAEMKFNPLAGCLPMLLQMPIFIALFQVLREMGDRIGEGHVLVLQLGSESRHDALSGFRRGIRNHLFPISFS